MSSDEKIKPTGGKSSVGFYVKSFKFLLIPLLFLISMIVGLWIGYVKLGGQPVSEMLDLETWLHLLNLVFKY